MQQAIHRTHSPISAGDLAGIGGSPDRQTLATEIRLNRTQFQSWMQERFGTRPHYLTIQNAIRRGMPVERHPLIPGRILFPVQRIETWMEEQRMQAVMPAPLRAAMSR